MTKKKRINREPIPSIIHQMTYKRLFAYLRSILTIPDRDFEPGLGLLLKGLYFKYGSDFYHENELADRAAFISRGIGFTHYLHPVKGKVVTGVFGPGEIVLNQDSFFNGAAADSGLEFIEESNVLFITSRDMNDLFEGFEQSRLLAIKTLAAMFKHIRAKDELYRLHGKARVKRFFEIYPVLLRPARKAPMKYKDIASYLNIDKFHFSSLMKELYPELDE